MTSQVDLHKQEMVAEFQREALAHWSRSSSSDPHLLWCSNTHARTSCNVFDCLWHTLSFRQLWICLTAVLDEFQILVFYRHQSCLGRPRKCQLGCGTLSFHSSLVALFILIWGNSDERERAGKGWKGRAGCKIDQHCILRSVWPVRSSLKAHAQHHSRHIVLYGANNQGFLRKWGRWRSFQNECHAASSKTVTSDRAKF